jgi:hypothetical protein
VRIGLLIFLQILAVKIQPFSNAYNFLVSISRYELFCFI